MGYPENPYRIGLGHYFYSPYFIRNFTSDPIKSEVRMNRAEMGQVAHLDLT
jgi:hypothetical protein